MAAVSRLRAKFEDSDSASGSILTRSYWNKNPVGPSIGGDRVRFGGGRDIFDPAARPRIDHAENGPAGHGGGGKVVVVEGWVEPDLVRATNLL